jgi:tRNA (guanine-N7-)-methyltransferase
MADRRDPQGAAAAPGGPAAILPRTVRSFVRREGRMTDGQRSALARCWQRYGVELQDAPCDLDALFGRAAPRTLEIGFGMGESLAAMAESNPGVDYVGLEVYRPGIGHLLRRLEERRIANVRLIAGDAAQVLERMMPAGALDAVLVFFPDPWPKKRHHKRRLIQPGFVAAVARALRDGGRWLLATDWQDYAAHMLEVIEAAEAFVNVAGPGRYAERPGWREVTKFEARGRRQGRAVFDLQFSRKARMASSPE